MGAEESAVALVTEQSYFDVSCVGFPWTVDILIEINSVNKQIVIFLPKPAVKGKMCSVTTAVTYYLIKYVAYFVSQINEGNGSLTGSTDASIEVRRHLKIKIKITFKQSLFITYIKGLNESVHHREYRVDSSGNVTSPAAPPY